MTKRIGWACLAGFIFCIWLANYAIAHWGTAPTFPGGPHTVTLLGLTAPSGVLVVGASFSLRDGSQMALGRWHVLFAIVAGAFLAYFATNGNTQLAVGSAVAFLVGETCDWAAYTPLIERGQVTAAIVLSNTVGAIIDSLLFLWIAFGWSSLHTFLWPQTALKILMIVPALLIVIPVRLRRNRALLARNA